MKILIFEYITGGGLVDEALPTSLVNEGMLMVNAVSSDFLAIDGINIYVLRDRRLQNTEILDGPFIITVEKDYAKSIDEIADSIDAMLIIAPETENILLNLCKKYSGYNFNLLNSVPESIALTTNKYQTFLFLNKFSINQIPTYLIDEIDNIEAEKIIAKTKDGVGCENIIIFENLRDVKKQNLSNNYIYQPYMSGKHVSLSLLCWGGESLILTVNEQSLVEEKNTLNLERCIVNAFPHDEFIGFIKQLATAITDLKGYIGVDLIITNDEIFLVEINPRLTTSYVGIRDALGVNPAQLILKTFLDKKLPKMYKCESSNSVVIEIGKNCAA